MRVEAAVDALESLSAGVSLPIGVHTRLRSLKRTGTCADKLEYARNKNGSDRAAIVERSHSDTTAAVMQQSGPALGVRVASVEMG